MLQEFTVYGLRLGNSEYHKQVQRWGEPVGTAQAAALFRTSGGGAADVILVETVVAREIVSHAYSAIDPMITSIDPLSLSAHDPRELSFDLLGGAE